MSLRVLFWVPLALALASSTACGSDGSGDGGSVVGGAGGGAGSGSADCNAACAKVSGAGCPNEQSVSDCVTDCQAYRNQCATVVDAFVACVTTTATFQCDNEGEAQVFGCDSQTIASGQCTACVQVPTDTACESCSKTKCCNESKTYVGSADSLQFSRCIDACTTETCREGCQNQFPSMKTPYQALLGCVVSGCATECT